MEALETLLKLVDPQEESEWVNCKKAHIKLKQDLEALEDLKNSHIDFIVEDDKCYFKIKNSKGKEKSYTSYTMLDFWKGVFDSGRT